MSHSSHDLNKLPPPRHIAIIMDGNGRWAKKRGLPRTAGHAAGAEAFRRTANYCRSLGVEYLTVYAFSTENWKRSEEEINGIMLLLGKYLKEALRDMEKNHVRFRFFGDLTQLDSKLQKLCLDAQNQSAAFDHEVQVNFCLNYGGRDEIVKAANRCVSDGVEITEENISARLYATPFGSTEPDLIIRTGGYQRLSGYLTWESIYSELYLTQTLFPDLSEEEFRWACKWYEGIERTHGGDRTNSEQKTEIADQKTEVAEQKAEIAEQKAEIAEQKAISPFAVKLEA